MIDGYEAFSLYQSLKLHFNQQTYDFFKYNGKTNTSKMVFENRKDKYHFYKLARKVTQKDDLVSFLVANFVENENVWIGDLLTEDAEVNFRKHQKIIQSLSYIFENDCKVIFEDCKDPNELLSTNGDHPRLLTMALRKEISPETLIVLNAILQFLPMWDRKITDTIRWPDYRKKLTKYASFLTFDTVKYKLLLKKIIL
jgi:hypothetical protein